MIFSVVRIVSVASNFWFLDDYIETLSGTTKTILTAETTETTQSSEINLSSILASETILRSDRDDPYDRDDHMETRPKGAIV